MERGLLGGGAGSGRRRGRRRRLDPRDAVVPDEDQLVGADDLATVRAAQPQLALLKRYGPQVQKAAAQGPGQWRTWWLVCAGGQVIFLPFIFVMAGRWSPRKAREDALEHQRAVDRELAALAEQGD